MTPVSGAETGDWRLATGNRQCRTGQPAANFGAQSMRPQTIDKKIAASRPALPVASRLSPVACFFLLAAALSFPPPACHKKEVHLPPAQGPGAAPLPTL